MIEASPLGDLNDPGAESIRVYTHNIYARRADWPARRTVLIAGISALAPDVVLFQEEVLTDDYDQTADILGDGWHVAHSAGRSIEERSGIAVASRWPITSVAELDLTVGGRPLDEFAWASLLRAGLRRGRRRSVGERPLRAGRRPPRAATGAARLVERELSRKTGPY